ncbi:MAG: hypothetical protein MMC23_000188 [Stictis urceolatum]|nr:hypothetical protein [Stictis urceolata]
MNAAGIFFLILLLLVLLPGLAWATYIRWRAHHAGLPAPPFSAYNPFSRSQPSNYPIAPRRGGALGWLSDKISGLKSSRGGGYQGRSNRGFGPLDPDGAWDDRVGNEAEGYGRVGEYEEQELGLRTHGHVGDGGGGNGAGGNGGAYGGQGYGERVMPEYGEERGRSRSRDDLAYVGGGQRGLDERYDEEMHASGREDPFGERAERSDLRGVSPRPVEMDGSTVGGHKKKGSGDTQRSGGRKSMFQEAM